jgi:hypothetical protein
MVVREPESNFVQCPPGLHAAVCVDEVDLGLIANRFDPESDPIPTVRLVWQIAEDMPDGRPFLIKKEYRASLHEKAGLRHDLQSWRGREFSFDELVGFDLEKIVGVPCMLNIVEKTSKKGKKFSNIVAVMPLAKGLTKIEPRDYVRVIDRKQDDEHSQQEPPEADFHGITITDDDVPF